MIKKIKELLGIKPKKEKIELTGHEKAITIMYLNKNINFLERESIGRDETWAIYHDVDILRKVIRKIENDY